MKRFVRTNFLSIGVAIGALLAASLVAVSPVAPVAAATVQPWNVVFRPLASADKNPIPKTNAPTTPWTPPVRRGSSVKATPNTISNAGATPQLVSAGPVGLPGLGALPYFSFDKSALSLDTIARVNLGNGNLLLTSSDGVLNGAGLALRNDRFYNGLSTAQGSFGAGWSSSLSQVDVGLSVTATDATYRGANGFSATFTLSGSTYTAPAGFNTTLTTDTTSTDKRYTLSYNSSGEKITFSTSGYITTDTERNSVGSSYSYGTDGRVSTISTASGRNDIIGWTAAGSTTIAQVNDSAGRNWQYDHNAAGQLTRVTKPGNNFENYTYDSTGRVSTAAFSGAGNNGDITVTFGYDSSNRITSITRALVSAPAAVLSSSTYVYVSGSTTVTDGNGHTATYTIDSSGRVSASKDALNRSRSTTWTANSDVQTSTDALGSGSTAGNVTAYSYDQLNNATGVSYPTGAAASATYAQGTSCPGAGSGNPSLPKCTKDDAGNGKSFQYDTSGNLTGASDSTTGGTAAAETYTYETASRSVCGGFAGQKCSSTNAIGGVTHYAYNTSGDLTSVTPPAPLGPTTYVYDSTGRVTSVTDGNNQASQFTYNSRDEVLQITYAGGSTVNNLYYQSGLVQSVVDATNGTKNYTYDGLGRVTEQTGPASTTDQKYSFDKVSNITSYTDANGTVAYTYDAANQLTQLTEPGGSCTTGTTAPTASSGCVKFTYNNNGVETKRVFPGGAAVTTTVDNSGRATRITATDAAGATASDVGYSFGAGGSTTPANDRLNIQTRTSYKEVGVTAGAVTTYAYDSLARLTSATERSGTTTTAQWSYSYDKAGNRTQQVRSGSTGSAAGTTTYTYNSGNELTGSTADTSTWAYDGAGNQTRNGVSGQTAGFNSRLAVTAIGSSTYQAFGQGNSETLTRSASSTSYTSASLGLMSETTSAGTTSFTRSSNGKIVGARGANRLYYVFDSIGSVLGIFDATGAFTGGYSYSPAGETRSATNSTVVSANPLRFTGGYLDTSTGLYRLGARYYDPTIARFTQFDPSGQEKNPYSYAGDNPVNNADLTGLSVFNDIAGGLLGLAVGVVCEGATLGLGTIGCGVAGLAVGLAYTYALNNVETGEVPTL